VEAREILRALESGGGRLVVDEGGRLGVQPASQLTDALRAAIRAHRDELRELVQAAASPPEVREPRHAEPAEDYTAWTRGDWDEFERLAGDFEDQGMSKEEAVALARQRVARARAGAPASELADAPVVAAREQLGAVLIRSPRFGEVWVVLEPSMATELIAEEAGRGEPRPVLLAEDLARLVGRPDEMIRAALAVLATFPGARVTQ
jgi:hypothetical protein